MASTRNIALTGPEAGAGPHFTRDLAARLATVSSRVGGHAVAAGLCGVSLSQFKRYVAGRNQPTFETVVGLAQGAGISLEWLATGRGRAERKAAEGTLDEGTLSLVLGALDDAMAGRGVLPNHRRAAVAATAYAMVTEGAIGTGGGPASPDHVGRVVERLVALAVTTSD